MAKKYDIPILSTYREIVNSDLKRIPALLTTLDEIRKIEMGKSSLEKSEGRGASVLGLTYSNINQQRH